MARKRKTELTFIEEARRKQIIAGTVKTIARKGMVYTTLEDIAEEINVSKGVISYHFANKAELIHAVLDYLILIQREHRARRLETKDTPIEKLKEYIRADMDFYGQNRETMLCWWEIWSFFKSPQEKMVVETKIYGPPRQTLTQIIQQGQEQGMFRPDIDPFISATIVEGAIEGIMMQWIFDETQVDLQRCGEDLIALLEQRFLTRQLTSP